MTDLNLTCPRLGCNDDLESVRARDDNILYECRECDETLREDLLREFADEGDAVARLADVLLKEGDA